MITSQTPIFREILGPAFDQLPEPVKALHDSAADRQWRGQASVRRGRNPLARLVAAVMGFPPAAASIPVTVAFSPDPAGHGEIWTRDFGGRIFRSRQAAGRGKDHGMLVERFGGAAFTLALEIRQARMYLTPHRWTLFGMPMPGFMLPGGESFETAADGRFCFHVEIRVPVAGLIVGYQGWLEPEPSPAPDDDQA